MSFAVPRGATGFDAWDSYIKREAPAETRRCGEQDKKGGGKTGREEERRRGRGQDEDRDGRSSHRIAARKDGWRSEPETDELMLETAGGSCFRASNDLAGATTRRWCWHR